MLFNAKKIIIAVKKCHTKFFFKLFMARVRINKRYVNEVFERAWATIENSFQENSTKTIQRIWRGYFERIQANEEVERLKLLK